MALGADYVLISYLSFSKQIYIFIRTKGKQGKQPDTHKHYMAHTRIEQIHYYLILMS